LLILYNIMKTVLILSLIVSFLLSLLFGIGAFAILNEKNIKKYKGEFRIGIWFACMSFGYFLSLIVTLIKVLII